MQQISSHAVRSLLVHLPCKEITFFYLSATKLNISSIFGVSALLGFQSLDLRTAIPCSFD